ncbi:MAG: AAA family ATPase [Ardenticatenaceae bacterium]|nr:AAA family ATPase [Ardenticatenaceae bacterium]
MFKQLIREISKVRELASTFYKVDLHIHSFESYDFPKLGDKTNSVKEYLKEDESKEPALHVQFAKQVDDLRIIAVTDHNKSRISVEISKLSDENLLALPGMEATLKTSIFPDSNVHVLAIFPENHSSEDIEKVFTLGCGMPNYEERTKESAANMPVKDFIQHVHQSGGLCIAGHVNSNKGVRSLFRDFNVRQLELRLKVEQLKTLAAKVGLSDKQQQQLKQHESQIKELDDDIQNMYLKFLFDHDFDAVEVQRSSDFQYYSGVHTESLGIKPIACLLGSDAHNLQDIGLKGSTTYVKMRTPSFKDLKLALKDPSTRIRYEDTISAIKTPRILGMRYGGGFFEEKTLGFSDDLTCLIGGRGSGKSATIESLRYVFQHDLEHLGNDKQSDIGNRLKHTLSNSAVEILFEDKDGDRYVLKRDYGLDKTECLDISGNPLPEVDVSVASNLDIKIFGWGEIEELARNKFEQLNLIDGFIPEVASYKDAVSKAQSSLIDNTNSIVSIVRNVQTDFPKIEELPLKKAALERISTEEIDKLFAGFDKNEKAIVEVSSTGSSISSLKNQVNNSVTQPNGISDKLVSLSKSLSESDLGYDWVPELQEIINVKAMDLQNTFDSVMAKFDELIEALAPYNEILSKEKEKVEAKLRSEVQKGDVDDLSKIVSRRKQLSSDVKRLEAIEDKINNATFEIKTKILERYSTLVPNLEKAQRELTDIRKEKIVEINAKLDTLSIAVKVSLSIDHLGNRATFKDRLGAPLPNDKNTNGILKNLNRRYLKEEYALHISDKLTPSDFVKIILEQSSKEQLIVEIDSGDGETREVIPLTIADAIIKHLTPYVDGNKDEFDPNKLETLLELEHLQIQDLPIIMLDGEPIEELSPGQRCSTLIPIILLESSSPLIIDQPEDNLDNKLVFDLVVDILRSLKQKRQIIVATHNPNIPVSGDAEQVVVYETISKDKCTISTQGSIDDDAVVDKIKAIMEGSEDAFRIRAQKYGYSLSAA